MTNAIHDNVNRLIDLTGDIIIDMANDGDSAMDRAWDDLANLREATRTMKKSDMKKIDETINRVCDSISDFVIDWANVGDDNMNKAWEVIVELRNATR
jgi:hypothetical protein